MGIAVAAAGVGLFIAAALAWTARLLHVGSLDALELAEKVATPEPLSVLDWPELRVRAVVPQPGKPSVVLVCVEWPAHREQAATLLLSVDGDDQRWLPLLSRWCTAQASISPSRRQDAGFEFRRRQSLERVHGVLIAEDRA